MPAGASPKREREYEDLKNRFKEEHRYPGREEEVAARIVNKQRRQYGETKQQKARRRRGESSDQNLPIESYQTLTVAEAKKELPNLGKPALQKIRRYETRHKNRKTMLEQIDRQLAEK